MPRHAHSATPHTVAVFGAGPAGLSTALWCQSLGLEVTVFEAAPRPGGQLSQIPYALENVPGQPHLEPSKLLESLENQLSNAGVSLVLGEAARLAADACFVTSASRAAAFDAVVLACGVRRRRLDVEGEAAFLGRGLAFNMGPELSHSAGRDVLIVGGGDDAYEHAHSLVAVARSVCIVHRGALASARPSLRAPVEADPRVERLFHTQVRAFRGDTRLGSAVIEGPDGVETRAVDQGFLCIGPAPNSEGFGVPCDPRGYVLVDRLQRTRRAGVYAVGDLACPEAPTLATAMGQGAVVAKTIVADLVRRRTGVVREGVDRLRIEGVSLPARIGVYPRERNRRQTLSFSYEFEIDAAHAHRTDHVRDTIDYAAALEVITEVVGEQHFHLIETVAERVAQRLLARFDARAVKVCVHKPGVPQRGASASVEVTRRQR